MRFFITLFSLVFWVACAPSAEMPVVEEKVADQADLAGIELLFDQLEQAVNSGDADAWLATLEEDAVFMPPNEPVLMGKQAIESWGTSYFDQFIMEEEYTLDEIDVVGDCGYARGTYSFQTTLKAGGESVTDHGKFIGMVRRQDEGTWKLSSEIWNSNLPAE